MIGKDARFRLQQARRVLFAESWIYIPTVIWSTLTSSWTFIIDPLFFPLIERNISKKSRMFLRSMWALLMVFALALSWNIRPASYPFFLGFVRLDDIPQPPLLTVAGGLLVFFVVFRDKRSGSSSCVGVASLAIIGIALCAFLFFVKTSNNAGSVASALRSPVASTLVFIRRSIYGNPISDRLSGDHESPLQSFQMFSYGLERMPSRIVLMIVESWAENERTLAEIARKLAEHGGYSIRSGLVPFDGGTLQGEVRELCSLFIDLNGTGLARLKRQECAPRYLAARGYKTIGLHGYLGHFYNRAEIWPALGIQEALFRKQLRHLKHCKGAFYGICDDELIEWAVSTLRSEKNYFLYILTLTSHEPLLYTAPVGELFSSIPSYGASQRRARSSVARLVGALRELAPDGDIALYIVGDHISPSLIDNPGVAQGVVPFLIVEPRAPE